MNCLIESLPEDINNKIFTYLSHPVADLMRGEIKWHKIDNNYYRHVLYNTYLHDTDTQTKGEFGIEFLEMPFSYWHLQPLVSTQEVYYLDYYFKNHPYMKYYSYAEEDGRYIISY